MRVYLVNNRLYTNGKRKGGWFDLSEMEVETALGEVVGPELISSGSVYWRALGYEEAPLDELAKFPTIEALKSYQELSQLDRAALIKEQMKDKAEIAGLDDNELVEKYWEETANAWLKARGIE